MDQSPHLSTLRIDGPSARTCGLIMELEYAPLATALKAFTLGGANRAGILAPAPRALNETPTINLYIIRIGHWSFFSCSSSSAAAAAAAVAAAFGVGDEYIRTRHNYTLPPPRLSEPACYQLRRGTKQERRLMALGLRRNFIKKSEQRERDLFFIKSKQSI